MIGPFKPAPGGFRYVYIAIDKFSKWIENKPLVLATAKKAVELFEISSIDSVSRTALSPTSELHSLVIIFGTSTKDRCISVKYIYVAHPRANGQVKQANDMILDALKKRLYQKKEKHLGR